MKGKLIVFEGVDGCGKSTQIKYAYKNLIKQGLKVYITREPGGTIVGEEIRKILKGNIKYSKETEAYLFAAIRCEHNILINKMIDDGYIVLCDRHVYSSYVFQDYDFSYEVNKKCMEILNTNPNIICYNIGYNERNAILNKRCKTDRYEDRSKSIEDYLKIQKKYKDITKMCNGTIIEVTNKTILDVHKETMTVINNIIRSED